MKRWPLAASLATLVAVGAARAPLARARPIVIEEELITDVNVRRIVSEIADISNGYLNLGMNVDMTGATATFNVSGTEVSVDISALGLDYVPTDFLQYNSSQVGLVAMPSDKASWTTTTIKAKANGSGTITLVPFSVSVGQ